MRKKQAFLFILLFSLLLSACGSGTARVSTDGSTSMEKVVGMLGEAFELDTGISFTYNPTGSGSGIRAVQEGRCDIGLSSRNLSPAEAQAGLSATVLAYDGIAVIVNPENPIRNLSCAELTKIYTGELTNWSSLGGAHLEIVPIGREAGSGTRSGFEEATNTQGLCRYRQELTSSGDVISTVSRNPGAIGYASLAALKDTVKRLSIDGAAPTERSIQEGSYPIRRPFLLITGEELNPLAAQFFDYSTSPAQAALIRAAGVIPAARNPLPREVRK